MAKPEESTEELQLCSILQLSQMEPPAATESIREHLRVKAMVTTVKGNAEEPCALVAHARICKGCRYNLIRVSHGQDMEALPDERGRNR